MASRTRHYSFILYPDSETLSPSWLADVENFHVPTYISPLHDKDLYERDSPDGEHKKGDLKKAHYHIMLCFPTVKSLQQVQKLVAPVLGVECPFIEPVNSSPDYFKYLSHQNAPNKAQYSADDILCLSGATPDDFPNKASSYDILREILFFCRDNGINTYATLVDICIDGFPEWLPYACGQFSGVLSNYFRSSCS